MLGLQGQLEVQRGREITEAGGDAAEASAALRQGMELAGESLARSRSLAEAHPADAELSRDLYIAAYRLGLGAESAAGLSRTLGRPEEEAAALLGTAMEAFVAAEGVTRTLAMDASNLEAQRDLGLVLHRIAKCKAEAGDLDGALAIQGELGKLREEVFRTDRTQRHQRDLAVVEFARGELNEKLAAAAGTPGERVAYLRAAEQAFEASLRHLNELAGTGMDVARELAEATAGLERVRAAQG
jgi:hypothetical protein